MSQQSWTESLKVKDLTEQIGQGFGILNTEGKFEYVNGQLAEMLGYNQEELLGFSYHSLFKMDGTDFVLDDSIHEKEITLSTKTRKDVVARLTVRFLNDDTNRWYLLLTKIDYGDYRLSSDFLKALDLASPRRMVVGRDLKIQYVSTAFMTKDPEQLIGVSALEGVSAEYRDGLRNVIEAVFEEGVIGSIEISDSHDDESTSWFVLRISPIRQGDDVIAVVITSINITERKHTEMALRESEEKFRGIFENANDGVVLTDEKGHISAVNSAFEKLYGVKRTEILDKPLWEVQASLMPKDETSHDYQKQIEQSVLLFFETGYASWLDSVTSGEFIHPISGEYKFFEQQVFKIPSSHGYLLCSFVSDISERSRIEEARKRSEQLYRALFEQNNDAVFILDLNGRHIDVNQQAANLLGYSIEELKEIGMRNTVVDRESDDSQNRLSDLLNGKTLPIYERTLRKKNGDEISVDVNVSLVRDNEGNPLHIQSIMRDISDIKRTLQSLKESEERLDFALHGADLGVWDLDTEKDELRFSERYLGIVDYTHDEIGTDYNKWETLIHPDDLLIMEERWNAHVRGETPFYSSEHRMRTKSGEYRWVLERGKVVEKNEKGGIKRATGTLLDITERVIAEQALREEESKYRTIVEQSLIGIAILPAGPVNVQFANSRFASMLDYSVEEIIEMNSDEIVNLIHIDDQENIRDYLRAAIRNESRDDYIEARLITRNSSLIWVELSAGRIDYQGSSAVLATINDITKRREMEAGLRVSETKGRMLLQSLNDIVIVHDENDNYAEVYTGTNELLYTAPSEFIGRHVSEILPEDVAKSYLSNLQQVRETGIGMSYDYSLPINDEPRWFSANITLHEDKTSVVVVIRDITARYEAEITLRRDRRIFHDLAQSFIQAKDINEMASNVLTGLATNYGFDFGLFAQYDPKTNLLQRIASIGEYSTTIPPAVNLSDESADSFLITHVFRTSMALFISDIEREVSEKSYLSRILSYGAKSVMAAPILDDDNNVLAVYSFATDSSREFNEGDFEIFSTITRMLGTALERRNAELQKQKAQDTLEKERKAFQSIATAVVHTSSTGELSSNILSGLIETLDFDFGTLRLFDEKEEVLRPTAIVGMEPSQLSSIVPCSPSKEPQHLVSFAAINKEKIIASDIYAHESTLLFKERLETINVKSILIWPLLNESDNLVGTLSLGSYSPLEISETTRPFFDAVAGMLNTVIERWKTEQALKISKRRYRELITDISEGIGMADLDERIIFVNDAFANLLGYTAEELVGMSILDLSDPEDLAKILKSTEERRQGKTSTYTHRFIRSDGEKRIVRVSAVPSRNDDGEVDGTIAIVTDITEQVKAEDALKESEARFRSIFETSPVGMHLMELADDGQLMLIDANPAANSVLRSDHSELFGKPLSYIMNRSHFGRNIIDKYEGVMRTGVPWNTEDIIREENTIVGAIQVQVFRSSPRTMVTTFLDVTERVVAELEVRKLNEELTKRVEERTTELAAANKELEAFAYSVSHDLRAPLRTLDGFSQALLEDYSTNIDETGQDYLRRIRAAATRMGGLIEDVLGLSRVTRIEMDRTNVNLSDIAREIVSDMTELNSDRTVDFRITDVAIARCDRRLIKVAIQNLLENAWKFTGKSEDARIEFGVEEQDGKTVFFVKDNGAGFEMKYKEKLFTPFQRLHQDKEFEGSGIGLATVQRVVNRHGGLIWAESIVGEGATFYFTLPE